MIFHLISGFYWSKSCNRKLLLSFHSIGQMTAVTGGRETHTIDAFFWQMALHEMFCICLLRRSLRYECACMRNRKTDFSGRHSRAYICNWTGQHPPHICRIFVCSEYSGFLNMSKQLIAKYFYWFSCRLSLLIVPDCQEPLNDVPIWVKLFYEFQFWVIPLAYLVFFHRAFIMELRCSLTVLITWALLEFHRGLEIRLS